MGRPSYNRSRNHALVSTTVDDVEVPAALPADSSNSEGDREEAGNVAVPSSAPTEEDGRDIAKDTAEEVEIEEAF
jgi:hypothetical protein